MNVSTIAALGAVAVIIAGCETLSGPQAVANAEAQRQECKAILVTSTAQSMRMQNQRGVEGDQMRRTEGVLALGQVRLHEPPALRSPIAPEESLPSKTLRDC